MNDVRAIDCCSILWFPRRSHVELEIDGTLYNLFFGCVTSKGTLSTQRDSSLKKESSLFYQFRIALTAEEKQQLLEQLHSDLGAHTCSGHLAQLLFKVTRISCPWFTSWMPSTFAKHLYHLRQTPDSRVFEVECVGQEPDAEISRSFSQGFYSDLSLGARLATELFSTLADIARGERCPG
jgi:hypothetical protein